MLLSELKKQLNVTYEQLGGMCIPAAGYNTTKNRCDRGWLALELEDGRYIVTPPATAIFIAKA